MRRVIALLSTFLLAAAVVTACGDDSDDQSSGPLPTVDGELGAKPTVTAPDVEPGADLVSQVVTEGDGPALGAGDFVVADYVGQIWRDNIALTNSYDGGAPVGFGLNASVIPGWLEGLTGKHVGSRVLLVVPPDKAFGEQGAPDSGVRPDDTLVFVIDLLGGYPKDASISGEPATDLGAGLPTVSGPADAKPSITIPSGAAKPTETTTKPVITGDGRAVEEGDLLVVKYVGVAWSDGRQFDASWDRDPQMSTFTLGDGVIKGWVEGLTGVNVGSRVMIVVPPTSGYGEQGTSDGSIKPNETLVFVIDVLGAY